MKSISTALVILFCIAVGCKRDAPTADPVEFLTAHVWKSTGYVISGRQYDFLEQNRAYVASDQISTLHISPGDTMKYGFTYELLFTNDYTLKETRYLDVSYKCKACNTFLLLDNYAFYSEEVYTINNTYLFVTAENVVLLDSSSSNTHRYRLINNQKMELFDWRIVRNTSANLYNISVNGISVQPGEEEPVDMVFEAIL